MAGNILTAEITIKGTRPLLWHAFGEDAIPLTKQEREGVAGNDPSEWQRSMLVTPDNQLYVMASYVFGCLRDGAKYTKKGRGSVQSALSATLQISEDIVLIDRYLPDPLTRDRTQPVYLDVRSVRNPSTKGRNVRYRVAASPGWLATFSIYWDKTIISRNEMQAVARDAGTLSGIGDGRTIGCGRFAVEAFDIVES